VLDWGAILNAAGRAGTEWYIVEQDHPRSPLEDVATSLRFLQEQAHGPSIGTMPRSQPL
jgi:sugar phosphate isomerase/epimerase